MNDVEKNLRKNIGKKIKKGWKIPIFDDRGKKKYDLYHKIYSPKEN